MKKNSKQERNQELRLIPLARTDSSVEYSQLLNIHQQRISSGRYPEAKSGRPMRCCAHSIFSIFNTCFYAN